MKTHLVFDTTDVSTILDSDNVGAYVRAADGTLITKTTVGLKEGLDVNLINSSIVVTANNLDIRDLTAVSDSVQAWTFDGIGNAISSTGGALNVSDSALANTAIATAANTMTVANTAEDVVASPLTNRKYLFIQNVGNLKAYVGPTGVTSGNGYPIFPGSELILRAGAAIDIEWVASNTSQEIRTLELA